MFIFNKGHFSLYISLQTPYIRFGRLFTNSSEMNKGYFGLSKITESFGNNDRSARKIKK